jgi:hypothetical protein
MNATRDAWWVEKWVAPKDAGTAFWLVDGMAGMWVVCWVAAMVVRTVCHWVGRMAGPRDDSSADSTVVKMVWTKGNWMVATMVVTWGEM